MPKSSYFSLADNNASTAGDSEIENSDNPFEDLFLHVQSEERNELTRIAHEMFDALKGHLRIDPSLILPAAGAILAAAAIFGAIGLTSWNCNYEDAVPELVEHFKTAFNIDINDALTQALIQGLRISAGVGGAGGNAILNYFGTRQLYVRWQTIKQSLIGGNYGYFLAYALIGLSSGLAAASNGFVVAESADTTGKEIFDFLVNFGAAIGPHMLFAIPFVGLVQRSPLGDVAHYVKKTLDTLKKKCFASPYQHINLEELEDTVGADDESAQKKEDAYLSSTLFNICRRLIMRAGYALASLSDDNENHISRIQRQIDIIIDSIYKLQCSVDDAEVEKISAQCPDLQKDINTMTSQETIGYLLDLNKYIANWPLDLQVRFFLCVANKLGIQPESDLEGIFMTLANSISLQLSIISCFANLTSINEAYKDIIRFVTNNPEAIKATGLSITGVALLSKNAMYWNSFLSLIERAFLLPETLSWLWQSSKLVKIFIPTTGMLALLTGVTSGACYALDFLNLFPNILGGALLEFANLFGEQGSLIAITTFVLLGWVVGAGAVNGNALSSVVSDIVLSIIHIFQPEQKANDLLSKQAMTVASKIIGNMVPSSEIGLGVEKAMRIEYKNITTRSAEPSSETYKDCLFRFSTFGLAGKRPNKQKELTRSLEITI